ncbi:WD repeat-containing protein 43 [Phlyctochytrium planicorne]|nr:WD repeat-containing protein 43 [Phlyctochytrium planicorne]
MGKKGGAPGSAKKDGPVKQPSSLSAGSIATLRQNALSYARFIHSAFDTPRADYFAAVTQVLDTHKISVWDCRNSSLVVSLSPPSKDTKFTCLAWGRDWGSSPGAEDVEEEGKKDKKKKRRRSGAPADTSSHSGSRVLVAGTGSGEILVYSLAHGSLQATLQTGILSAVKDFAFAPSKDAASAVGYSASASGDVLKWNLSSGTIAGRFKGDENSLSKLAVDAVTGRLAVAGHQIRIYDPVIAFSGKASSGFSAVTGQYTTLNRAGLLKEYTGHATEILGLTFAKGGSICLSSATEDRFISVWDGEKNESSNISALTTENPCNEIAVSSADHVLALSEGGEVELWNTINLPQPQSGAAKKAKANPGLQTFRAESSIAVSLLAVGSRDESATKPTPILAAVFSDDKIVIAYGSTVKPTFERVGYLALDGTVIKSVTLTRGDIGSGLLVSGEALASKSLSSTARAYRELEGATILGASDSVTLHASGTGAEDDDSKTLVEPTLEERLNSLNIQPIAPNVGKSSKGEGVKPLRKPTATSLHSMLAQAVHSNDKQLLETTLTVSDPRIILATVRRLQPSLVVPLLDMLVGRLQAKPNRAAALIDWVRSIVVAHAAFLMTDPALVKHLGALYQALDSRVSTFEKLIKLSGRLDLVMSQIALRASANEADVEEEDPNEAEAFYDEEAEDEEDDQEDFEDEEGDGNEDGEEGEEDEDGDLKAWDEEEEEEDVGSDEEEDEDEDDGEEDDDEEEGDAEMMDEDDDE